MVSSASQVYFLYDCYLILSLPCSSPLPPLGHISDVMLVWRKGHINKLSLCCSIVYYYNGALQCISATVEGLISPEQAGFWKDRSTCDQVAALTTIIENGFQQNLKTGVVFLDLTAAYDIV